MTDVEIYYEAIRKKWSHPSKPWHELHPQQQIMVVQSINLLLMVLNDTLQ